MCTISGGEAPRLTRESFPVARKEHTCCECGSTVTKGEKYEKIDGLWDDFETYKTCMFCSGVRISAHSDFDLMSDEGFAFGELWECVGSDYGAEC